jgi:Ca-activated chloride channel family protein
MRILRLCSGFAVAFLMLSAGCAPAKSAPPADPSSAPTTPRVAMATTGATVDKAAKPRIEVSSDTTPSLVQADKKDQEIVARVRVHGLAIADKKRPPLNLALVVDTSGSMEGQPIDEARAACATLIDLLTDGDAVSIVTFGTRAKVVVPSVRVTKESREAAKLSIRSIKAEGTTDMAAGLAEGLTQVRAHATPDGIHRIVLVGDGVPNDAPPVLALADSAKSQHVPVTALGLGNDFDETLMTALAQRSSGTFHFVNDTSRVASVFKEQISRMERVVARGARIELTPGPGVTITEVLGIPASPTGNGRGQIADLGDLAEGQTRDVYVRVTAKGRRDGKSMELLDAQVSYSLPEGGAPPLTATTFMKLNASSDAARLKEAAVVDVEHGFTTVRVADGIVKAIGLAREGELTNARKLLDASLRLAKEGEKKFADKGLGEKVIEMTKLRKTLPSLAPPPEAMNAGGGPSPGAPPPKVARPVAPSPAASPADAMDLRAAHGDAMKAIQGD